MAQQRNVDRRASDSRNESRRNDRRVSERRKEGRVAVSRRGLLKYGGDEFPCLIMDMSSDGFFIVCTKPFLPRQMLQLNCELYPAQILECTIEVRHVDDDGMGTMIVGMEQKCRDLCARFLGEIYSSRLENRRT